VKIPIVAKLGPRCGNLTLLLSRLEVIDRAPVCLENEVGLVRLSGTQTTLACWQMAAMALSCLALAGCAGLWDELTSKHRDLKSYFKKPPPMVVLKDPDADGFKKGQALASLVEPLQNGGTQAQQDETLKILNTYALTSDDALCRLGAVRALGKWKDTRAVTILDDLFLQNLPFDENIQSIVRQQVLASLEETGNPEARHRLILVARQPFRTQTETGAKADVQRVLDEKLTAIRALGSFKQSDAVDTLISILEKQKEDATERDVALSDRAWASLKKATGRDLPPDPAVWREFLADPNNPRFAPPSLIEKVVFWWR
jgi:hypothetical protein